MSQAHSGGLGPPAAGGRGLQGGARGPMGRGVGAASPSPSLSRGPDTARSSSCPGAPAAGRYRAGTGAGWGEGGEGPRAPKAGSRLGRPTGEGPVQRNAGGLLLFPRKDRASWQLGAPQEPQAHGLSGSRACPASCVQLGPRPEETQHPPAVAGQGRGGGPRPAPRHCTWASTPPNPTALHWPGPLRQG